MPITLEHYNFKTSRLAETVKFYTEVLGLTEGFYPVELGPGAWLYDATGTAVAHIQSITEEIFEEVRERTRIRLGTLRKPIELAELHGTGAIDHIAFSCTGFEEFRAKLDRMEIPYTEAVVVAAAVRQLFVVDPNGIILELNFRG